MLRIRLAGANASPAIRGLEPLTGRSSYFVGKDPSRWRTNIPAYARVEYRNVYPGVNLIFYGNEGKLEYDFVVLPGGRPEVIRLEFDDGVLQLDPNGDLSIRTSAGEVHHREPLIYQWVNGSRRVIDGGYVFTGPREVGFRLRSYDRHRPLIIDPVLVYSMGFGGSGQLESVSSPRCSYDTGTGLAVDTAGNAYVAGVTSSADFPTVNPLQSQYVDFYDVFVAKLDRVGNLVYATYVGGVNGQIGTDIAVDSAGNAIVTGRVFGPDFPMVNALRRYGGGDADAFVLKLNAAGSALMYSTFLGGSGADQVSAVALDAAGNAYVAGSTDSADFPTTAGVINQTGGGGFLAKISANGSALLYSTYFTNAPSDVAAGPDSSTYLAGSTASADFPTTAGAFQRTFGGGGSDAYVAKLNAAASELVYSTFLGREGADEAEGVTVDDAGNAYVTGSTRSAGFPTTSGVFQTALGGAADAFVAKLNATGSALVYSTFLGGKEVDTQFTLTTGESARAIAVDSDGNAYVTGTSDTLDFPTVRPIQATAISGGCLQCSHSFLRIRCTEAFVAKLSANGARLIYSTYVGGSGLDYGRDIAVDSAGSAYVLGTAATGFPLTASVAASPFNKVFIAKIADEGDQPPVFASGGVVSAASYAVGLSPGGLVTIFGSRLTTVTGLVAAGQARWPNELEGTSVTINGMPAPIFAVANVNGSEQINLQAPYEIPDTGAATLIVKRNGSTAAAVGVPVQPIQPAIFTIDGVSGAVQHARDFSLVTRSNPAQRGEAIIIYATGLGKPDPPVRTGYPAPDSPLSLATGPVRVFTDGGIEFPVLFAGLAPRLVGVWQINSRIPANVPAGTRDLVILLRDRVSSNSVKLAVE